ncbi:MAG: 23S rRNA (adenine(2503)-C(2))-methyltransferase RlmN [Limisphaerales bacterium]
MSASPPAQSGRSGAGSAPARRPIQGLTRDELASFLKDAAEPAFRLDQVLSWVHARRADRWDEMSNLPKTLRSRLAEAFDCALPELVRHQGSVDTTQKFLWRLRDGALIESVLIPANPALFSDRSDRHTLCVSTQVGCAYGCRFCASGLDGWKRNLTADEIIGQVHAVERWHLRRGASGPPETATASASATESESVSPVPDPLPSRPRTAPPSARLIDNLVIMGMGEPLANYDNLLRALRILNAPWGGGIGARKITVSTSGLVPQIRRLAEEPEQFRLAISLHGATDAVRNRIMPVNRKHPLADLAAACSHYLERKGRMITFEYILLAGVNDAFDQVQPLAALARRLHAKVNLIPYNAVEGLPWKRPDDAQCAAFAKHLERLDVTTTLRIEKGHDIDAACGQLRLKTEREERREPAASSSVPSPADPAVQAE